MRIINDWERMMKWFDSLGWAAGLILIMVFMGSIMFVVVLIDVSVRKRKLFIPDRAAREYQVTPRFNNLKDFKS
jgi:hypothetical protein